MTATKPSHVPSQGPQRIFSGENRSSERARRRFLRSFVIVSFRAFPLRDGTLPEVNVLLNQSATAGNKIPPPRRSSRATPFPFLPFRAARLAFAPTSPVKVLRTPSTPGARPPEAPRPLLEERRGRSWPARWNALFRRAEECVMPRRGEVPLPVRRFLFLFVCCWGGRGNENKVGCSGAALPCLFSETCF